MNYQALTKLGSFQNWPEFVPTLAIPIGTNWKRINFALAGYGHLVHQSFSEPTTATINHSLQESCTITHSVMGA